MDLNLDETLNHVVWGLFPLFKLFLEGAEASSPQRARMID